MNINLEIDLKLEKSMFFSPSRQQKHGDDTLEAALPAFLGERMRDKARRLLRLCIRHNFDLMMTPPGRSHHSYTLTSYMLSRGFRPRPGYLRQAIKVSRRQNPDLQARAQVITRLFARAHHRVSHTRTPRQDLVCRGPIEASYSSVVVWVLVACGSAVLFQQYFGTSPERESNNEGEALAPSSLPAESPYYTDMTVPQGHLGNLTPEQEVKLRELWAVTLKTFGVANPANASEGAVQTLTDTSNDSESVASGTEKKKKSRLSVFGKKHDTNGSGSPSRDPSKHTGDDDDKYGQVKEYQQIVATQSPESLRMAFWSMVKADHPDALLLRFLRARKWDVDRALVMMISTMSWRSREMHVDDDVVKNGEGGALEDCTSSDRAVSQEGKDFLAQLRLGKSFLHGTDKEGRPLCFVRARLHHGGDQSERSMERYTVYVIETARLVLRTPVETACIVFDMSHFTMANMDYAPVKFMIKVFEANYPESLGIVLVHKAPWLFNAIWKIIKGWLDPVVASKVHFTSDVHDLEQYIPKSQIIKELGGEENWEYKYVEPVPGENALMKEEAPRIKLDDERQREVLEYQRKTFEWIVSGSTEIKAERDKLAHKLNTNYWQLDPYIRARTIYDRTGVIDKGGKVNFYPERKVVNGAGSDPPPQLAHEDDLD